MPVPSDLNKRLCTLLLFVATPAEEEALKRETQNRGLAFEALRHPELREEYHWLGAVGNEIVIAVRPIRQEGRIVMGSIGRLGSAARAIRFAEATGAKGIVQLGMAFGIDRKRQRAGDVLVSSSLIPYDNRDITSAPRSLLHRLRSKPTYIVDYSKAAWEPARPELVSLFMREQSRGGQTFGVNVGAILSGAARIQCEDFRDELVANMPPGEEPIIGGEMEGVGLLAASSAVDDPIWCVVKGISDFADVKRHLEIDANRPMACNNAAAFVLSALENDALSRYD
jgi:nucleoside phosphorylase